LRSERLGNGLNKWTGPENDISLNALFIGVTREVGVKRVSGLLGRREFHLLLFHLCLILFGWPVVSFNDVESLKVMYVYLFFVWISVIFLLFLISRSVATQQSPEDAGGA
jgi:hypothetical protein